MPVHSASGGGKQWGKHGKVYHGKNAAAKAAAQGRAAYANGYRGDFQKAGPEQPFPVKETRWVGLYDGEPVDEGGQTDE